MLRAHSEAEEAMAGFGHRRILGIPFFAGTVEGALSLAASGGLVVVPSGPVLVGIKEDAALGEALRQADLAITDSGLMVLLWNLWKRDHLRRVSGLEFLARLLQQPEVKQPGATFWVAPDATQAGLFRQWLQTQGIPVDESSFYVAPTYPPGYIEDDALRQRLEQRRPRWVVLCIGGCVQERLGLHLRRSLSYRPAITCTGAALGFLAGTQVKIPMWADRLRIGWFLRCLSEPQKFVPRYWRARGLIWLLLKHGTDRPPVTR